MPVPTLQPSRKELAVVEIAISSSHHVRIQVVQDEEKEMRFLLSEVGISVSTPNVMQK